MGLRAHWGPQLWLWVSLLFPLSSINFCFNILQLCLIHTHLGLQGKATCYCQVAAEFWLPHWTSSDTWGGSSLLLGSWWGVCFWLLARPSLKCPDRQGGENLVLLPTWLHWHQGREHVLSSLLLSDSEAYFLTQTLQDGGHLLTSPWTRSPGLHGSPPVPRGKMIS